MRSRECYFGVYFPRCCAINTKITLEWTHKQFVTRVHTLFYFLHDITNPSMTLNTRIFKHHPRVSLARFPFCWCRHNRLLMTSQWPDNCDAITWTVISNSLDINFIHGDIHGRSCKNVEHSNNNMWQIYISIHHISYYFFLLRNLIQILVYDKDIFPT